MQVLNVSVLAVVTWSCRFVTILIGILSSCRLYIGLIRIMIDCLTHHLYRLVIS